MSHTQNLSGSKEKEAASITTGAIGGNTASKEIKVPKPVDHSAQSGFGEQEAGTGIGRVSAEIREREE